MNIPLVSVIIPVYNVENWLERCLNSLRDQQFKDYEVICIDDCSTDNSPKIIEKFIDSNKDIKFKFIKNSQNQGISTVRKKGIDLSSGKYIFFLDSDDYLEKDCLELLTVPLINHPETEVVSGNYRNINSTGITVNRLIDLKRNERSNSYGIMEKAQTWTLWNRLIKRDLIKDLEFPPINNGEDFIIMAIVFYNSHFTTQINKVTYNYNCINLNSIVNNPFNKQNMTDRFKSIEFLQIFFKADLKAQASLEIGLVRTYLYLMSKSVSLKDLQKIKLPKNLYRYLLKRNLRTKEKIILILKALKLNNILFSFYNRRK